MSAVVDVQWSLCRKVRQAVLVATSVILLVLPSHCLLTDLQVDMMETKAWLESMLDVCVCVCVCAFMCICVCVFVCVGGWGRGLGACHCVCVTALRWVH